MTKRQRSQVVELLRCAADGLSPRSRAAWTDAINALEPSWPVESKATEAFFGVLEAGALDDCEKGRWTYLEAAARVEEGWVP